jgi:hypothetical protein
MFKRSLATLMVLFLLNRATSFVRAQEATAVPAMDTIGETNTTDTTVDTDTDDDFNWWWLLPLLLIPLLFFLKRNNRRDDRAAYRDSNR